MLFCSSPDHCYSSWKDAIVQLVQAPEHSHADKDALWMARPPPTRQRHLCASQQPDDFSFLSGESVPFQLEGCPFARKSDDHAIRCFAVLCLHSTAPPHAHLLTEAGGGSEAKLTHIQER